MNKNKFRAWGQQTEEFRYFEIGQNPLTMMLEQPVIVEQCTGLQDKNGKEIYEGDRIKEGVVIFHTEYLGFFVRFEGNIYDDEYKPLHDIPLPEIIGNIHEGEKQ